MKKNKILRLASVMLMLCLITTCAISGTFAKYTTDGTATDIARVAKWGVVIDLSSMSMFKTEYAIKDATNDKNGDPISLSVKTDTAGDGKKLVAPGTTDTLANVTITGKPEVAVNVKFVATLALENWTTDGADEYCPIVFTVNSETYGMNNTHATHKSATIDDLVDAVKAAIDSNANYGPNTDLSTVVQPSVSWTWDYVAATGNTYQTDDKDTKLGDRSPLPSISFTLDVIVEQID